MADQHDGTPPAYTGGPSPLALPTMLAYSAASLGAGAFYLFANAALPLFLRPLTDSDVLIGLLSSARSIEGVVVRPLVGACSDTLRSPIGRRRPFYLVAIPLAALFLALTPFAPSLGWTVAAIVLFSLCFNVAMDPYNALLADITPLHQRATLSSLATLIQFVGQVGMTLLLALMGAQGIPPIAFALVAGLLLAGFAITAVGVREPPRRSALSARHTWSEYLASLAECRDAQRFFVALFVVFFGMNGVVPFLTLYAVNEIGLTHSQALYLILVMVVVIGALAVPFGRLGDRAELALPGTRGQLRLRIGSAPAYKPLMVFGVLCLGAAALLGTVATSLAEVLLFEVVAGVGTSALTVLWWPMLTTLIPHDRLGVFAGLSAAVQSIALPLSVVLAGALIDLLGTYRVVFAMLGVMCILALAVFAWLGPPRPARPPVPDPPSP